MTRKLSTSQLVSALAIATGMVASQTNAAPKGFLGNFTVPFGSVGISTSTDTTNILVNSSTAVIDWTPDDNVINNNVPITFLDSNGTVNFQGFSDFAVLNRLNIADNSRQILLNGAINSSIGQSGGGKIFFYSPSGFIVGSGAAINVGSLLLSASPIAVDGNGSFITGTTVTFGQAPNALASIVTATGSQINAYGSGSYVALVAPKIVHSGTIRTDTAAALVAAEAGTITFSPDGLFNIQVTNGTDAATGIDIDGGTITRNSAVEGTNHRAYLVAVARNDAVTMLVRGGGSVGFDTATSAAVEDNVVVLSGGYDVVNGDHGVLSGISNVPLTITNASLSSDVDAQVTGGAAINSGQGALLFGGNLSVIGGENSTAGGNVLIDALNGNALTIGGNLFARAFRRNADGSQTGLITRLGAESGGVITIGGNATLDSDSFGLAAAANGLNGTSAIGGNAQVNIGAGSTLNVTGSVDIHADGYGGGNFFGDGAGGNGIGGQVFLMSINGGATVNIGGPVHVSAQGYGGSSGECSSCNVTGGVGVGGSATVHTGGGFANQMDLGSGLTITTAGHGGAGDLQAGAGVGGTSNLGAFDGSTLAVGAETDIDASGFGGFGFNNIGGVGVGGEARIGTNSNGSIDLTGQVSVTANGQGGGGAAGGNGIGGKAFISAFLGSIHAFNNVTVTANSDGAAGFTGAGGAGLADTETTVTAKITEAFLSSGAGTLTIDGLATVSANATGGTGDTGGAATGGRAWVQANTGGDILVNDLSLSANAFAGQSGVQNGATGTGGYVIASASGSGATLTVTNSLDLEADGRGGFADSAGATGGAGLGGQADIFADNGGTVTLSGSVAADANGQGGNYIDDLSTGGNGTGGNIFFQASNGATLDAASNVVLTANGYGGYSFGDCNFCGGTGGNGTGGNVTVQTYGTGVGMVAVGGLLSLTTNGFGSSGFGGAGGNGLGGMSRISVSGVGSIDVTGDLDLIAVGKGGDQYNGGTAGNGTGGDAEINLNGTALSSLRVGGATGLDAGGLGGSTSNVSGGAAGSGTGGWSRIYGTGGQADFTGAVAIAAQGTGGDSLGGTGGNGSGGRARLNADGANYHLFSDVLLNTNSTGGLGAVGGAAITLVIGTGELNSAIFVNQGGSVLIDGSATLTTNSFGGDGDNGGSATAGRVGMLAQNGDIRVTGAASIGASAYGGAGANGGNGGDAAGGYATIRAVNSDLGPSSVTLGDVSIVANGTGGDGGAGLSGNAGTNGGNGGSGSGGSIPMTAAAGNGTLVVGNVIASAQGFGGRGGDGGGGDGLGGGNGGTGGAANGGLLLIGTESGDAQATATNAGSATFTTINALASATGGDGGGFSFGTPFGQPGNGGAAHGGQSILLGRGAPVVVGAVTLDATAYGGDGGFDEFDGNGGTGGKATAGQVQVDVRNRFNFLTQRGTLNAGNIVGTAGSFGGVGAIDGPAGSSGGIIFNVINSDATIASVSLTGGGDFFDPTSPIDAPSRIAVRNGTVTIAGGFTLTSPGAVSIWSDGGNLSAASINVSADNFIHDLLQPAPVAPGTFTGGTITLSTLQDLIVDAHLSTPSPILLTAPALVQVMNVTSGGTVTGNAGTDFIAGNIDAADGIDIVALGNITLGALTAGVSIAAFTDTAIELDAGGSIVMGDATAQGGIDFTAGTTVTGGNLTSGLFVRGDANGAIILGNLSGGLITPQGPTTDGFSIGIASGTSILVGNAAGAEAVGFATLGALTTGNIDARTDFLAFASGNMSFGSITTGAAGRTYLADSSMFLAAGGVDNFDPTLVFPLTPVATSGSIAIAGPVSTGKFQAAAGTSFTSGPITSGSSIFIRSGGSTTTGNLGAGTNVNIASSGGAITTGSITATSGIVLNALTGITTGAMSTGNFIDARSGGSILTGNLITTSGDIFLLSDANIATGTVTAASDADVEALGNVTLGVVNVGGLLFVDAGGNLALASAQAGAFIDLLAGGTLTGGNLTAGQSILARSNGALALGDLSAGIVNPSGAAGSHVVGIGSNTTVQVGNVNGADFVGLTSAGALTAGAVQSGGDIVALVNGPATLASIANPQGRTYIAGFAMLAVGGGFDNFDPALVYAAANPVPTTGSITITGATNTGRLDAFVGGNFTTGAVNASAINARVGGLATLNGLWQSPDVELWSNDIDIAATGGIDAGNTGSITLVSTNATQALIGDGLTGTGYQLSNAEFGRLSSGSLVVAARGDASAAIDMLIGDLDITGPTAGSTIDDPNGSVVFVTGNPNNLTAGGVIRVVGDVRATGFQPNNVLEFVTGQFELDADTGSILVEGATGVLGGILDITADRVHVASGAVLQKLTVDPLYAGREADLAAPIAVARPDGVIAADTIYVSPTSAVLVQNTGTSALRAGFRARYAELFPPEGALPGSIELIVNGQLETPTGRLTGVDVRDALVDILDIAIYTDNSSINGCPLTGACSGSIFPPGFTPTPGIQDEITLIKRNPLPPPNFGNEDFIDDNDDETDDGATGPIVPPQPLFDTSALADAAGGGDAAGGADPIDGTPMRATSGLDQKGDVDDPVSGGGNPALMDTPPAPPVGTEEKQP